MEFADPAGAGLAREEAGTFIVLIGWQDVFASKLGSYPIAFRQHVLHAANLADIRNPVGAGLAREEAGTFNILIGWQDVFASKLGSYRFCMEWVIRG